MVHGWAIGAGLLAPFFSICASVGLHESWRSSPTDGERVRVSVLAGCECCGDAERANGALYERDLWLESAGIGLGRRAKVLLPTCGT